MVTACDWSWRSLVLCHPPPEYFHAACCKKNSVGGGDHLLPRMAADLACHGLQKGLIIRRGYTVFMGTWFSTRSSCQQAALFNPWPKSYSVYFRTQFSLFEASAGFKKHDVKIQADLKLLSILENWGTVRHEDGTSQILKLLKRYIYIHECATCKRCVAKTTVRVELKCKNYCSVRRHEWIFKIFWQELFGSGREPSRTSCTEQFGTNTQTATPIIVNYTQVYYSLFSVQENSFRFSRLQKVNFKQGINHFHTLCFIYINGYINIFWAVLLKLNKLLKYQKNEKRTNISCSSFSWKDMLEMYDGTSCSFNQSSAGCWTSFFYINITWYIMKSESRQKEQKFPHFT